MLAITRNFLHACAQAAVTFLQPLKLVVHDSSAMSRINRKDEMEIVGTFLGTETEFTGKLMFDGMARIDGNFRGDIFGVGTLVIGEGAKVLADIHVDTVMAKGEIRG